MTLDDLRASAPRSFDKILVDLIAAIQQGERPIIVEQSEPPDDPAMQAIAILVERVEYLTAENARTRECLAALIREARRAA
jgi:hypothetical protein